MAGRLPKADETGRRAYPVPPAPSLLETMWGRLDEITAELMRDYAEYDKFFDGADGEGAGIREEWLIEQAKLKGEALGVAWCISVVQSPYAPDVDAVRAEAMVRYQANQKG